jgi:methyl-accepting chemotaxis protein
MSEQEEGSQRILDALARMSSVSATVRDSAKEMNTGSTTIGEEIRNLLRLSEGLRDRMRDISEVTSEIGRAAASVRDMGTSNSDLIDELVKQVQRFKLA